MRQFIHTYELDALYSRFSALVWPVRRVNTYQQQANGMGSDPPSSNARRELINFTQLPGTGGSPRVIVIYFRTRRYRWHCLPVSPAVHPSVRQVCRHRPTGKYRVHRRGRLKAMTMTATDESTKFPIPTGVQLSMVQKLCIADICRPLEKPGTTCNLLFSIMFFVRLHRVFDNRVYW